MSRKLSWLWRNFSILMVLLVVFSPLTAHPAGVLAQAGTNPDGQSAFKGGSQDVAPPAIDMEEVLAKLDPALQTLVKSDSGLPVQYTQRPAQAQQAVLVNVLAFVRHPRVVEMMRGYFENGILDGFVEFDSPETAVQVLTGMIMPYNLLKVAQFGEVEHIYSATPELVEFEKYPIDDTATEPEPKDWAELRANAAQLREGSLPWDQAKAIGDGGEALDRPSAPEDWFEMDPTGPAKAATAWDRGFHGEGVKVAVIDDGVDFAHPDLMGKQEIYTYGTGGSTWKNGWPYIMDPFALRAYYNDLRFGTDYSSGGFVGVSFMDTSATPLLYPCGVGLKCFNFTPLIDYNVPGFSHTYMIQSSMTQSGVVHVGTHHDESLRDYVWGEKVAILVTDPNVAGVYDTVYIDLDDDYDFSDEKPLTKAVVGNLATYNDMIAYRDMNADGKADLSGGLLYFIADGAHFPPGFDYMFRPDAFGLTPPAPGSMVAIHGPWISGYSHGTQCASNVVASGQIDGMLPEFSDLPPGPGVPAGAVYGAAPEAGLVAMNTAYNFSGNITYRDAYYLAAYGWDGRNGNNLGLVPYTNGPDADGIQITSNSYGFSGTFNDGWEMESFVIDDIIRRRSPGLQFLFSTGNGGPGYGTAAPPLPQLGIGVGASTEFGSTGWDSITSTLQINYNDIIWFSNSGPGMRDGPGAEVLAGGGFAAGAEELNYYSIAYWGVLDGNISWASWGGTSRSSPTAMGVLALIYQAYKAKHGVFPTAAQAKAIFMGSATDVNNDVFRQGGGAVNADVGTASAAGLGNVYLGGDSNAWSPGDFRGVYYPEFAHLVYPGTNWNKTFTLINDSPAQIDVGISTTYLELIDAQEFSYDVDPAMVAAESPDNFYKAFEYFIPLTGFGAEDNLSIPADTDLMVVRQILPFDEFDVNFDYTWDNRFYLTIYNWKDINSNGIVWDDKNANGVVNFVNDPSTYGLQQDGAEELDWDHPDTELDRWEYGRFSYNRTAANVYEQSIQDPLERMHDGMFLGLRHLYNGNAANITTHLQYRVEYYKKADLAWLNTDVNILAVPAGGSRPFQGQIAVPADMPPGTYAAAIEVTDPGDGTYSANTLVIPVTMNVAKQYTGMDELGGWTSANYDANTTYNNGMVRGFFDWSWREESGDWRNFYLDIDNAPVPVGPVIFSENFDAGIPGTWTVGALSGTGTWENGAVCGKTNLTGGSGEFATADSDCHDSDVFEAYLQTPSFSLVGASMPQLQFNSDYYHFSPSSAQVLVSTDGGTIWTQLSNWTASRRGPRVEAIDLTPYVGQADVRLRFQYSTGGDVYLWYWQIDNISVSSYDYPFDPTGHVILRDVWEGPAPATDIDTIVFGPAAHPVSSYTFGVYSTNGYVAGTYGPYALNSIVARSNDNRAARSIWRFDTSSGANEEWLAWTLGTGGLHEILQHNVLFEGDQFGVVYTKTLGLLTEDVHSFTIDTYMDQGVLGDVVLQSTIPLNGLVASGYLTKDEFETWTNEPIDFTGAGTLEWFYPFTLQDAVSIDLTTSSGSIPDIDLNLYYYDPNQGAYVRMAYSAGATSDEHVLVNNPADGDWLIAIDNYSGPAGTFNMTKVVKVKMPGIDAQITPSGPLAANTPATVHVTYDAELALGANTGFLYVGPPEAPQLKEIPITINRLADPAKDIEKTVDFLVHFAEDFVDYTINLYNQSAGVADFHMEDPIPDHTSYVSSSVDCTPPAPCGGVSYNAIDDEIVYHGPLSPSTQIGTIEDFEHGGSWPAGWTTQHDGATVYEWVVGDWDPHGGTYHASIRYDSDAASDEWLFSPAFDVTSSDNQASFWVKTDTEWPGATLTLYAVDPGGAFEDELWDLIADETWPTFEYRQKVIDLSAYEGQQIKLAWRYHGLDGDSARLDDIALPGMVAWTPSATVNLRVQVDAVVTEGTQIENVATLFGFHVLPQETQYSNPVDNSVIFTIAYPDLTTSYKLATETADQGGIIDYEIHLINTGTGVAVVQLEDPLPAGALYFWHDPGADFQFMYDGVNDKMVWNGVLFPGEEKVFSFSVIAPAAFGEFTNTAHVYYGAQHLMLDAITNLFGKYFLPLVSYSVAP